MSDPRYTEPRTTDPRLNDPVLRKDEPGGAMWGWVAGLAVLALIAFVVVAGWNSSGPTASTNSPPPITTGADTPANAPNTPMRNVTPPASTTGSGATSPEPATPAPSPNGGR